MKDTSFPNEILDSVRDLKAHSKRVATELDKKASEAKQTYQLWSKLSDYLSKQWPFHVVHALKEAKQLLEQMRQESHPAIPKLEDAYKLAESQMLDCRRRYPALLEKACSDAALEISQESRHPRYLFENGFFQLEVDDQGGIATLSDSEGKLNQLSADVGAVVELIQRERKRVFERPFKPEAFLKRLRNQYLQVLKKQNKTDGTALPIRNITSRLGKNVKGFRTDEFLVDLSRLVENGPLEIDGYRLDLQQTKDTSQGMLLHGRGGRGYIGFVLFRRV